jgi:hypothetical protein
MCEAIVRASLAASAVLGLSLAAVRVASISTHAPGVLAAVGAAALVMALAAMAWGLLPLRHVPSDARVARFIEERVPALEDRLATAVDVQAQPGRASALLRAPFVADVAKRAASVDVNAVVPGARVGRSSMRAGAAALVLLAMVIAARGPARQSVDAAALVLFPATLRLDVRPGHARVKQGTVVSIDARVAGNRAPVSARLEVDQGGKWGSVEMSTSAGQFHASLPATSDFKYRVAVGPLASQIYQVTAVYAPRVSRIDVDYAYPAALDLRPRTETDGGDLYAPAGTSARLHIFADRLVANGTMSFSNGTSIRLASASPTEMTATVKLTVDGSYRITLADRDGLTDGAQAEYFIRIVDDRPPDVHVVKPASDRSVTPLEEVDIEAQADDDYGLERVELVYAVRGQRERVVPLEVPRRATSATVHHTMYLEDLGVKPGDFVSYYVRAHDITRGSRPNEGRSDIFFLEVRPFEQEFALQQSQSMAGAGYAGSIDDLVNAQKQIVVATWKLDRRGSSGVKSARSPQDVRAIGRGEAELKIRVEETAGSLRESTLRDPRRRLQGRGSEPADGLRTGQTMPEEDAMSRAAEAMGRAATALDALDTSLALPPEMQALNGLLEAQALVKKRRISRQPSAQGGPGNNNRNYDISTLFDKELQRLQQTNYETRQSSDPIRSARDDLADKIRSLSRRQDELLRRQDELARQQLGENERKRQLEKLTREQSELRQQAEEMARQGPSTPGLPGADQTPRRLQEIADAMRGATGDLRRLDSAGGRERGQEALAKLRNLERRLRNGGTGSPGSPGSEDERRALGNLQLEARQLADAQREVAKQLQEAAKQLREAPDTERTGADRLRQLAGEQQRLAERAGRLLNSAKETSDGASVEAIARQRLPERMRESADTLQGARKPVDPKREAAAQDQIARDLDRAADVLQAAATARGRTPSDLTAALERARALRERLDAITQELQRAGGNGQRDQLRDQAARELQRVHDLIDELRRQDPSLSSGGPGFTFEGQGMTFSSPGTEGFKQDFARWQSLRDQATLVLGRVETSLSKRLQDQQAADRLAAGIDDKAPEPYRSRVDDYFKAIAARKAP